MEELYSRLAPVWDATLTATGFRRGLGHYIIRTLSDMGTSSPTVLDVGCGTGIVSFAVLKRFPDAKVVATDINRDMVAKTESLAKRRGVKAVNLTVGLADVLEQDTVLLSNERTHRLSPASFDIVIASGVLEYTPLDKAIPKLLELVRPQGSLLAVSMKDDAVGKVWGKMYRFKPIKKGVLEDSLSRYGCREVGHRPLTLKDFPANVTRTGYLAKK